MKLRYQTAIALTAATLWLSPAAYADTIYSVRPGDNLEKIAQAYGVKVEQILKANPSINDKASLPIGSVLILPDGEDKRTAGAVREAIEDATVLAGVSHDPPKATAIQIEGRPRVADSSRGQASDDEEEYVLDRAGNYHRRPTLASRHGRMLNDVTRTAHNYLGTPYSFGGTSANGIDCSGFVMKVFGLNGINLPRTADVQFNVGVPVPHGQEQPGDLVFFETYCSGPSHVGIYLCDGNFIHASSSHGVMISSLKDKYYQGRYLGAKRVF